MPPLSEMIQKLPQRVKNAPAMIEFMELLETDKAKAFGCMLILFGYDPTKATDLDAIINSSQDIETVFFGLAHRLFKFSLGEGEGVDEIRDKDELESMLKLAHPEKHIGKSAQELYEDDYVQGRTKSVSSFNNIDELVKALFQIMQNEEERNLLITWACSSKIIPITLGGKASFGEAYPKTGAISEGVAGSLVKDEAGEIKLEDDFTFHKLFITLGKTNKLGRPFIFTSFPY